MIVLEYTKHFLSIWFSATNPVQATIEALLFVIGIYGIFKLLLFIIRYYIIYSILKKVFNKLKNIKFEDSKYKPPPSNKEDEKLRDEEKERAAEKIEIERMEREAKNLNEIDFKIILPEATGKWQKFILGQRRNMLLNVARQMQASGSPNFWQAFIKAQRGALSATRER
jgi:hypothetical protein